jgi:NADH dehydrogenase [ubiquinone] 1 alpha subcomplex assembly factor 5
MDTRLSLGPFDRSAFLKHRDRAAARFGQVSFLKDRAIDDICDRLAFINRHFERGLDVGSHGEFLVSAIAQRSDLKEKISFLAQCDISANMLERASNGAFVGDEEQLPLAQQSLDLMTSALSLHWVNDVPGFLAQARLALRPDGLFLVSFLGGRTLQELRAVMAQVEREDGREPAPRVSPFADAQDGAQLLQRAGFALPVADSDVVTVRYDTVFGLFRDLKAMGEMACFSGERAKSLTRTLIARAADIYANDYADPDGRIRATFEIVTLTGWSPHESQQKPLRRGSAKTRLADALGVREISAGEKPLN